MHCFYCHTSCKFLSGTLKDHQMMKQHFTSSSFIQQMLNCKAGEAAHAATAVLQHHRQCGDIGDV